MGSRNAPVDRDDIPEVWLSILWLRLTSFDYFHLS